VKNAFYHHDDAPLIVGGRYALGGKDVLPDDIAAVFDNLNQPLPMDGFTLGIVDDVTFTSLPPRQQTLAVSHAGITACKFWGMGSDGTVGANKSAIKIIGDKTRSMRRPTFPMTRRNPAALPFRICASATDRSIRPT
jgi:pyruvate-ferredoxin/flavodoxin oxidoreductase